MPPKTGPAKAKGTVSDPEEGQNTAAVSTGQSEVTEVAEDTTGGSAETTVDADAPSSEAEAPPTEVKTPDKTQREIAAELYPEGTDLWYGEVHGLVIAMPRVGTITPSRQWLRAIYQLTEIAQTFEWMALAKVPAEIQNRTDLLTDEQYKAVFNAWFTDEELTLPK